jgi:hypothetical protein
MILQLVTASTYGMGRVEERYYEPRIHYDLFFSQVRTPGTYLQLFSQAFKLILRKGQLMPWSMLINNESQLGILPIIPLIL